MGARLILIESEAIEHYFLYCIYISVVRIHDTKGEGLTDWRGRWRVGTWQRSRKETRTSSLTWEPCWDGGLSSTPTSHNFTLKIYTDKEHLFFTFSSLAVRNSLNNFVLARTGCLAILIRNFSKPFLLASFSSIPDRPIGEEVTLHNHNIQTPLFNSLRSLMDMASAS